MIAASVSAAILWYYVNNQRWDYLRLLLSLIFIARGSIYPKCHYSSYISFKISNKNYKLCYENRWSRCRFWKCHLSLPFIELLCPFMSLFFFSLFILLGLQLCVLMSIVQVESNWKISSCLFCMAMWENTCMCVEWNGFILIICNFIWFHNEILRKRKKKLFSVR